jgi:hypothetical protein
MLEYGLLWATRVDVVYACTIRPTLWPGVIITPPRLRPIPDAEVDGDWILWRAGPRHVDPVDLPTDFYLHELIDIPPDDLVTAAALVRAYG